MNKWQERENTIVNSIMSGQNSCGTLAKLVAQGGAPLKEFIRMMVRPTLKVCNEEELQLARENHALRTDNEAKRFALESVASNIDDLPPSVKAAMERALPGRTLT